MFGHRLSLDLDFCMPEHFDEHALIEQLQAIPEFAVVAKAPYTLHATIRETKVSFPGCSYPLSFPPSIFLDVPVADPRDIACLKVSAIASRGRRDFIDLYMCVQRYGLTEILRLFDLKFAKANFNRIHILKSLTFFADAEKDPMPHMLESLDWDRVKRYFLRESPLLA